MLKPDSIIEGKWEHVQFDLTKIYYYLPKCKLPKFLIYLSTKRVWN